MARLEVTHVTTLNHDRPISETHMEVRLRPLEGMGQRVESFALEIQPESRVRWYRDSFGNHVGYFDHVPSHESVVVRAHSIVRTAADGNGAAAAPEEFPEDFLHFREPVLDLPDIREIAGRFRPDEAGLDAMALWIHDQFVYRPQITDVYTSVDRVLELRSGVCQDFAHLFIAIARAMGVPCRYVSGYIHPGGGRAGSGASHAWGEAWCGERWLGYDPTNPVRADEHHVRVAVGRDYHDVPPTRGVYKGAATERMTVSVDVHLLT